MRLWIFCLVCLALGILSGCAQSEVPVRVLPDSPQRLDATACLLFDEPRTQAGCFDIMSKYNQDATLCDRIQDGTQDLQTRQNCKAQLRESTLFAKGIITDDSVATAMGLGDPGDMLKGDALVDWLSQSLMARQDCPHQALCIQYPLPDDAKILTCLCIRV